MFTYIQPGTNFVSITPATDLNDVHHVSGSGVLLTANEGIHMNTYFVPQLGPAPKWASFLENITEEMEDATTRSAYQDFKFVEKKELTTSVHFICFKLVAQWLGVDSVWIT